MTNQDLSQRERPSMRQVLWYSYGGALPPRYNTWVLNDVTCSTWWLRHFARVLAVVVPLTAGFLIIVPSSAGAARFTGIAASFALVLLSILFMLIDSDRRAVRAGYLASLPSVMRTQRSGDTQRRANHDRRERMATRRAKRNRPRR